MMNCDTYCVKLWEEPYQPQWEGTLEHSFDSIV